MISQLCTLPQAKYYHRKLFDEQIKFLAYAACILKD